MATRVGDGATSQPPHSVQRTEPGGLTVIPCPLCGILQDDPWMNFHLINGHGFAGGPGLPSPHTNSLVASEGYRGGGERLRFPGKALREGGPALPPGARRGDRAQARV